MGLELWKSPKYEYNRSERLSSGTVDITISVEQNRIADCRILVISLDKGDIKMWNKHYKEQNDKRRFNASVKAIRHRLLFW